jgi:anti-anti-sigma factor
MADFDSKTQIELERQEDVCILTLKGRLSTGTDPEQLQAKADEVKRQGLSKVLVDLRELAAIGSTGIGFVVGIYTSVIRNPAGRFVLVGANSRVREVLDLTRLNMVLPMAGNVASGLAMLSGEESAARRAYQN